MTNDELLKTFDDLAVSQDAQADRIVQMAGPAMNTDLAGTVDYLRQQAEVCRQHAQAIRDGALA